MMFIPRRLFAVLAYGLPILVVLFAVLMGFYLLLHNLGDSWGSRVVLIVGGASLMLLVGDVVLLVGLLSIDALIRSDEDEA